MATKVCVVGHRHLSRAGLAHILDGDLFEVALEVASLREVQEVAWRSGLFVVDKPESINDIEGDVRRLKALSAGYRVVVLAATMDASELALAFAAGVDGYLLEEISPEALRESLRLVMVGEHVFPSRLVTLLCGGMWGPRLARSPLTPDGPLSDRESEIVARLAGGMPNKVIASELTITEATVKVHLKNILKKLGVSNRTQAAVWAISHGVAHAPPVA